MEDRSRQGGQHAGSSSSSSESHKGTMSRQEAGHLGGVAPHECRGNECHERSASNSRSKSESSKSSRDGE